MYKRFDRNAFLSKIATIYPRTRQHLPIVVFVFVIMAANVLWGARTSELAASGITISVEKITTAQIQTMLGYLQEYAPPLTSPNRTQNTSDIFVEGYLFLNKPILTSTVISNLPREKITTYVTAEGDTLYTVAFRYELTVDTVASANGLDPNVPLKAGQQLKIPPVNGIIYTVAEGDTIENLAKSYRIAADSITKYNKLAGGLIAGQEIILPGAKRYTAPTSSGAKIIAAPGEQVWTGNVLAGSGNWVWPLTGKTRYITQYYGWVSRSYKHTGLDLDFRNGSDILATDHGTVVAVGGGWGGGYGNHIVVDHGNGYQTLYAHLSSILVNVGDNVTGGQKIGVMGTTGFSTGVHLHFEIRLNGVAQNPLAYLK